MGRSTRPISVTSPYFLVMDRSVSTLERDIQSSDPPIFSPPVRGRETVKGNFSLNQSTIIRFWKGSYIYLYPKNEQEQKEEK